MNISEFLEARIAEDEAEAKNLQGEIDFGLEACGDRLLTECEAKRSIVQYVSNARLDRWRDPEADSAYRAAWWIATRLAVVYKDHPDYQQEWAL